MASVQVHWRGAVFGLRSHRYRTQQLRSCSSQTGWKKVTVPADGNCLFHAIAAAEALGGKSESPSPPLSPGELIQRSRWLRKGTIVYSCILVDVLRQRRAEYEPFAIGLACDLPFASTSTDLYEAYLENMARDGVWGGELELAALSHLLKRAVDVRSSQGYRIISTYGEEYGANLTVLYHRYGHYEGLLPTF